MTSAGIDFTSIERLRDVEIYWAEKYPLFEMHGYKLRRRYQPGWAPSWRGKPLITILRAEDALSLHVSDDLTKHCSPRRLTRSRQE